MFNIWIKNSGTSEKGSQVTNHQTAKERKPDHQGNFGGLSQDSPSLAVTFGLP
jgi:hypothetical protein